MKSLCYVFVLFCSLPAASVEGGYTKAQWKECEDELAFLNPDSDDCHDYLCCLGTTSVLTIIALLSFLASAE